MHLSGLLNPRKASSETRKALYLVLEDHSDPLSSFVVTFDVRDDIIFPEEALRDAVREFLGSGSDETKAALEKARGQFDWGDALGSIPDSLFEKHGLTRVNAEAESCFVDY